ncbi:MAG: S9 family peptidase [Ignavibacteriaceae bacterium]|nr:S9 family peptidase [Ignavibacteriaceae bacterium]
MKKIFLFLFINAAFLTVTAQNFNYPPTQKGQVQDNYHGVIIADPYRWLEDDNSEETKNWVSIQSAFTNSYLENIPFREEIKNRFTEILNYERYGMPFKAGDKYMFFKNDGLQQQSVIYIQDDLNSEPRVFLDPNKLSDDGTVSISSFTPSKDGKYVAYGISRGGSDWNEIFIIETETGKLLEDHLKWIKFSGISWFNDGFYYSRYDAPKEGEELKSANEFHKIYYHKLGQSQDKDELIFESKEHPKRNFYAGVSEDNKYLLIYGTEGAGGKNILYVKDLATNGDFNSVISEFFANFSVIGTNGNRLIIRTDYNAANYRIISIDPNNVSESDWKVLIPEGKNVINGASSTGGKLFIQKLKDAAGLVEVYDLNGNFINEIDLPGVGSVGGFAGKSDAKETFYSFVSFNQPAVIYRYDIQSGKSEVFRKLNLPFSVDDLEAKRVFVKSKDGTQVPLFIVHKKGLKNDGTAPTLLYGYGGFNVNMTPYFSTSYIPLLENGGVYAVAVLRGGGEYGKEWHEAGMLDKKQNVFDDFIACSEYLISEKYTNPSRLAINGGSNGGLLVAACLLQRPELFQVAIPEVGVLDMLRYQKFTIGWAWVPEYGSSEVKEQFPFLIEYSPLHNVKQGIEYPATMITTADHDDRVFPAHSFKFAAEMQSKYSGKNPVLIRIETKAGHGAGTSTSKIIELNSDKYAFLFYNMGITPKFK